MVASALGMDSAPEDKVAVMSLRAAANSFGHLLGAAAGGAALELGGFTALGAVLAALFLAAALIHVAVPARVLTAARGTLAATRAPLAEAAE
jgi:predicted MFS family arabinose efflux permease